MSGRDTKIGGSGSVKRTPHFGFNVRRRKSFSTQVSVVSKHGIAAFGQHLGHVQIDAHHNPTHQKFATNDQYRYQKN
jgi:hypothetical protein